MEKKDRKNIRDILPLTPMQEGMLFHYLEDPGGDRYFEQLHLDISGNIETDAFENAWNFTIQSNEMLRTVFRWEEVKKPVQVILKTYDLKPKYIDLTDENPGEKDELIKAIKNQDRREAFDLRDVSFRLTLCKLQNDRYVLLISNHHILYDGWSNGILLKEFFNAYKKLIHDELPVKPVKSSFKHYIQWLRDRDLPGLKKYWENYLYGFDVITELPYAGKNTKKEKIETVNYRHSFAPPLKLRLEDFAVKNRVTPAAVFYLTWGMLLQKYNNCGDILFGTTISGRSAKIKGIENIVGLFINTLPLRLNTPPNHTVIRALNNVNRDLKNRETYESISLAEIKGAAGLDYRHQLFDSLIVVENYPLDTLSIHKKSGLEITSHSIGEKTNYDLTIAIVFSPGIALDISYNRNCFDESSIVTVSGKFEKILNDILTHPQKEVSAVELISEEEKRRVLYEFNDTRARYPRDKTVHRLFEEQAERTPGAIAVAAFDMSNMSHKHYMAYISYAELNRRSHRAAGMLVKKGLRPGGIAGILTHRSIETIVGILGILKAGGAYMPIDPGYPEERIRYMMGDSSAGVLLSETSEMSEFQPTPPTPPTPPSNPCCIFYTSGSTGKPKGVIVEHKSVVNLITWFGKTFGLGPGTHVLQLSDFTFDPTVEDVFGTLVHGATLYPGSRELTLDPELFSRFVETHQVHKVNFIPTMLKELLFPERADRLKSLRVVISGGEKLENSLKDRILARGFRLYNNYGPTEVTVDALSERCTHGDVTLGTPIANTKCFILDRSGSLLPPGVAGELCIAGPGLARGYLNNPELTNSKFQIPNPRRGDPLNPLTPYPSPLTPLYHTGDLARQLPDGAIEFLGRLDNQVKVRGIRIEPGEIENRLLEHDSVKEAVVVAVTPSPGMEYLCAYITAETIDSSRLKTHLSQVLPPHMVPSYFVRVDKIPLTANGKIDRKALPVPTIDPSGQYTAPGDNIEKKLVEIWREILGVHEPIGIDDNFFELGGHSLSAAMLISRVHKALDVHIPLGEIFENPFIRRMAEYIRATSKQRFAPLRPAEKKEYYPLSPAQVGLYIEQHRETRFTGYNSRVAVTIEGAFDLRRARDVFRQLIKRHDVLRTSFLIVDELPVQRIHHPDEIEFEIEHFSTGDSLHSPHHIIKDFIRPFDLSRPPLFRVGAIRLSAREHILVKDMHHIIADGPSMGIFEKEFLQLYRDGTGSALPPLPVQYKEFSQWRTAPEQDRARKKQEAFWLGEFTGDIPVVNLPLDYQRPPRQTFDADFIKLELHRDEIRGIKDLASRGKGTTFIVLLAVFNVLLAKWCRREDIVVGAPIAHRPHSDLEGVIGYFVNMLALRNRPDGEKPFDFFLDEVVKRTRRAYENRDYPYDDLVAKLLTTRDSARHSLVDVVFASQNPGAAAGFSPGINVPGLTVKPYENHVVESPFDLALYADDSGEKSELLFFYKVKLFKKKTIERLSDNFREVLAAVLKDARIKIEDIGISHGLLVAAAGDFHEDSGDFGF